MQKIIHQYTKQASVASISVYYQDLRCNYTYGINIKEQYAPASLMKIPTLLAYYKKLQIQPTVASEKISLLKDSFAVSENFPPQEEIQIGKPYELDDLVKRMILYSDNRAADLVLYVLGVNYSNQSDTALGLPITYTTDDFITVTMFGEIFKRLYDASYLNQQNSAAALRLLSKTDFPYGIVAGVPKHVIVAHKFGERENEDGVQLHDCGIIYETNHPYILCIMTKGKDMKVLTAVIKNIAAISYTETTDYFAME